MKRFTLVLLAFLVVPLTSGCSILLMKQGKYVDRIPGKNEKVVPQQGPVSRAEVIQYYGAPASTQTFAPPISIAQAQKLELLRPTNHGDAATARIARVDRFQVKGPTLDRGTLYGVGIFGMVSIYTLGVAEVVMFPLALAGYIASLDDVTEVRVNYDRAGMMVGRPHRERWPKR